MNNSDAYVGHPENLYVLGAWLAFERTRQGYSLRGLARGASVAPSLVSAIENQKTLPNVDTLQYLYAALHHTFVLDDAYLSSVNENIQALYYATYDQNESAIQHLTNALIPQFSKLKYSPLSVELILVEAFIQIHFQEKTVSEAFLALANHLAHLNLVQRQRYYLNLGFLKWHAGDVPSARAAFSEVITLHRESRAHAVALTMLAKLSSADYQIVQALEYAERASKLHAKYSNLFRKIEADFVAIKSYIEMHQLTSASSIIQSLSYVLVETNTTYWNELQSFKAYVAYRSHDYHSCIDYLSSIPEKSLFQAILEAQAHIHLNNRDIAKARYHALALKYPKTTSPHQAHLLRLLDVQFSENPVDQDAFEYFIQSYDRFEHLHIVQTLLSVLREYASRTGHYEILDPLMKISLKLMLFDKNRL